MGDCKISTPKTQEDLLGFNLIMIIRYIFYTRNVMGFLAKLLAPLLLKRLQK